jgi:lia operon protein LiaF
MYIDCNGINLQNVEVSMGVGDVDIRLAGGRLSEGLNRMVISGFVGDVVILAPKDMPLFIHTSAFVGDVDLLGRRGSGFGNTLDHQTENYPGATAKLYIAINCFISDIRVFYI